MDLSKIRYIVFYRAYRSPAKEPMKYVLFTDVREALSFSGAHTRYCSTMELCKVDFTLTDELLHAIINQPATEINNAKPV